MAVGAIRKINVVDAAPTGIAVGEGAVWVANELGDFAYVQRCRPEAGIRDGADSGRRLRARHRRRRRSGVGCKSTSDTISRIDPATNPSSSGSVGDDPVAVAVGDGSVWVTNYVDGTVSRVDPQRTRSPRRSTSAASRPRCRRRGRRLGDGARTLTARSGLARDRPGESGSGSRAAPARRAAGRGGRAGSAGGPRGRRRAASGRALPGATAAKAPRRAGLRRRPRR